MSDCSGRGAGKGDNGVSKVLASSHGDGSGGAGSSESGEGWWE